MEKISDYKEWARAQERGRISNLYLMPEQLNVLAKEERLFGEALPGGYLLLVDEGDYESLYFRLSEPKSFSVPKRKKPIMAELIYRQDDPMEKSLEILLLDSGFSFHSRCHQFSCRLGEISAPPLKWGNFSIGPAMPEEKEAVLSLWDKLFSLYDFHDGCKQRLDALLREGLILAVYCGGSLCGAAYCDIRGNRISVRHYGVDPCHQGKGLGKILFQQGLHEGQKRGCGIAQEWVAEENLGSIAIIKHWMGQTDRKLAQFVLE